MRHAAHCRFQTQQGQGRLSSVRNATAGLTTALDLCFCLRKGNVSALQCLVQTGKWRDLLQNWRVSVVQKKYLFSERQKIDTNTHNFHKKKSDGVGGRGMEWQRREETTLLRDALQRPSENTKASVLIPQKRNCWYPTPCPAVVRMDLSKIIFPWHLHLA